MTKVSVEKIGTGIGDSLRDCLETIDIPDIQGKCVLVKPNMGRVSSGTQGIVTSKPVIMAAVEYFLAQGASQVLLGDSPITGVDSITAFASAGITHDCMPAGSELTDMDADDPVSVDVPEGRLISSLKLCRTAAQADIIVSVPVMKTHMHSVVSLGLKNMKGCLYKKEKVTFHKLEGDTGGDKGLDIALSDMATVLLPDITIIDGTVGMEGFGPSSGETVHPGLLAAGTDCIATDTVGARLMGFDPLQIPSLRLCAERGLGTSDADSIQVIPENYLDYMTEFKPAPCSIDVEYEGIYVYDAGACSACLSTVVLFLRRYRDELVKLFGKEDIHIYIGDGNTVKDEKSTLLIGTCTSAHRGKGIFVQGCPPVASAIIEQIRNIQKSSRASSTE